MSGRMNGRYSANYGSIRKKMRRSRALRRRMMLIAGIIGVIITIMIVIAATAHRTIAENVKTEKAYISVTIEQDDTVWSIAGDYYCDSSDDDFSQYVNEICRINNLTTDDNIHTGAALIIPVVRK